MKRRRASNVARGGVSLGVSLKGKVPDHWTYRGDKFEVTGWHRPKTETCAETQTDQKCLAPTRGLVATSRRPKPVQERLL